MILDALAWIYFVGVVACAICAIEDAGSAQTPHGHAFILPPGFLLCLVWPLAALWAIVRRWRKRRR